MLSKDRLAQFDPAIKDFYLANGMINLVLEPGTVVVNFKQEELEALTNELKENK